MRQQAVIGAICDGSVFLGKNGLLNGMPHTSNHLEDLQETAGDRYTNESRFLQKQAVRSGQLITANGSAFLEFGKEVLEALNAAPQAEIDERYGFFKQGYYDYLKSQQ